MRPSFITQLDKTHRGLFCAACLDAKHEEWEGDAIRNLSKALDATCGDTIENDAQIYASARNTRDNTIRAALYAVAAYRYAQGLCEQSMVEQMHAWRLNALRAAHKAEI